MIEYQLCKEFPALSPFVVDDKAFHDVIKLYADVRRLQISVEKDSDSKVKDTGKKELIRRPAGDNWF